MISPPIHLPKWLSENADLLKPPVNNFCLYNGDNMIVMAVGGPNERSDYHVNETQEWFYQYKGDMLLRIVDGTEFRDVPIKEGEMFLLPREPSILPVVGGQNMTANTPHNPVRFAETIGIVIELQRPEASLDRLRWYCREPTHATPFIIREEAFHVTDLGAQLKPYITNWIQNASVRKCPECGTIAAAV